MIGVHNAWQVWGSQGDRRNSVLAKGQKELRSSPLGQVVFAFLRLLEPSKGLAHKAKHR